MNPHLERALLLYQQSRYEMAEAELRQALSDDPDDAYVHSLLALCLAEREQFEPATTEARQAIHLAPDFPFAHYALARVFCDRRRYDEALTAITEAIRLDSAEANFFAVLGDIHLADRRWAEALHAAEQGLALDSEHIGCTNLRAIALVKLGRRAEAGATIDAALAKAPENSYTHANQGWTYLEKGEPKKALEHFREALRLDPTNDWARQGIVEALKARNFIYAVMLKYFLWMSRLSGRARWGIVVGGYIGVQILNGVASSNPRVAPFVYPLIVLYGVFAVMTWLAYPLFNLMLRMNQFGRLALTAKQTVESNWVGTCFLLALLSLSAWLVRDYEMTWLVAALVFGFLSMPLSGIFRCAVGWPRSTMIAATIALLLMGAAATAVTWQAQLGGGRYVVATMNQGLDLLKAFGIGILISQFLANFLAGQRVKR